MKTENHALFESMNVGEAVLTMSIPMVISQAITIIYNVADTFFIGQMNDPNQVAAVTISLPIFYFLTALTNLFGVGGSGMVSRYLGSGKQEQARKCASFCIWSALILSSIYSNIVLLARPRLLPILGADTVTYEYTSKYIFWTICVGAVPTVLNPLLANLIRAEGYSKQASFGVAMGGILNIVLDPIFIFVFDLEIAGAAIATMLSTVCATFYFVGFIYVKRKMTVISFHPRYYSLGKNISVQTILVGLPNFVISFMATISSTVLNPLMASYSNEALAGIGIAKKIDLLAFAIAQGMSQGTLPLISYNFSSGNWKRMIETIKAAVKYGLIIAIGGMVLLLSSAGLLSDLFIEDAATAVYSEYFLRVISLTCPTTTLTLLMIAVFQATGKKAQSLFVSTLRKGVLDIPLMLILNHYFKVKGIVWAIPFADLGALLVASALFVFFMKKMSEVKNEIDICYN